MSKYVRYMLKDLNRNKSVYIGFCPRHDEYFLEKLEISPCRYLTEDLDEDGGEIKFMKSDDDIVQAFVMSIDGELLKSTTLTIKMFQVFAEFTANFGVLMSDNGNKALNI